MSYGSKGPYQDYGPNEYDPSAPQNLPIQNCTYNSDGSFSNTSGDCFGNCTTGRYLQEVTVTDTYVICCCSSTPT